MQIIQDGGHMETIPLQIYCFFLVLWRLVFKKATKFQPHISIYGQCITTSGCW